MTAKGRQALRRLTDFFGFRMLPQERQALETLAAQRGQSLSETIRQILRREGATEKVEPQSVGGCTDVEDDATRINSHARGA